MSDQSWMDFIRDQSWMDFILDDYSNRRVEGQVADDEAWWAASLLAYKHRGNLLVDARCDAPTKSRGNCRGLLCQVYDTPRGPLLLVRNFVGTGSSPGNHSGAPIFQTGGRRAVDSTKWLLEFEQPADLPKWQMPEWAETACAHGHGDIDVPLCDLLQAAKEAKQARRKRTLLLKPHRPSTSIDTPPDYDLG